MANDIQDFDKAALAEFGCRMCNNTRNAHMRSHGIKPRPCVWRNENYSALECFNCASLQAALHNFLKETR